MSAGTGEDRSEREGTERQTDELDEMFYGHILKIGRQLDPRTGRCHESISRLGQSPTSLSLLPTSPTQNTGPAIRRCCNTRANTGYGPGTRHLPAVQFIRRRSNPINLPKRHSELRTFAAVPLAAPRLRHGPQIRMNPAPCTRRV